MSEHREWYMPTVLSERVSRAQRDFMQHLRGCPNCDTHGKRCPDAQDMVTEIISMCQEDQEARHAD